jgi:hypothetical protein
MSDYVDRPKDIEHDRKEFVKGEYGVYILGILEEKAAGFLSHADNIDCPYPERYLAKHSAIKEVLNLFNQSSDDDTPTHG